MSVIGVEPRKIDVWIVSEWKLRHDFYRSGQAHALLGKSPKVGKHLKSDRICPHWWCRWISHHTPDYDSAFKTPAGNLAYIRIWERVYGSLTIYQQDATKYTLKKVLSSAVSDAYMVYYYYYPVDRGTDCASRQSDDDFTPWSRSIIWRFCTVFIRIPLGAKGTRSFVIWGLVCCLLLLHRCVLSRLLTTTRK